MAFKKMTMTLDELSAGLVTAYGRELTAVVLYGSAASQDPLPKRGSYNVLVLVKSLSPASIRASSATMKRWAESGHPVPLVMTEAEWRSSRDVFAMEFADILERHRVISGSLPTGAPDVDPAHLRHQLEFEGMGKLIRFRQALIACDGNLNSELELLVATKSAVMVLFRSLLRVHGESAAAEPAAVVRRAAELGGFDAAPFLEVVAHALGESTIDINRVDDILESYHVGLKKFVAHVDSLVHSQN